MTQKLKSKPKSPDLFKDKPWNSSDEYITLSKKHGLAGDELAKYLKNNTVKIPYPDIKPPKSTP